MSFGEYSSGVSLLDLFVRKKWIGSGKSGSEVIRNQLLANCGASEASEVLVPSRFLGDCLCVLSLSLERMAWTDCD